MPTLNIENFDKVPLGFVLLDPTIYICRVAKIGEEKFEEDKSYIEIGYEVVEGPDQREMDQNGQKSPVGREFHDRIYLTPQALWRLKVLLVASGLLSKDDKNSDMAKGNISMDLLLGRTVRIKLTPNVVKGREYRNIEYLLS